jgi:hypothetical protein
MYCAVCKCEFEGWTDTCPNCQSPLVEAKPPEFPASVQAVLPYDDLLDLVKEHDGQLIIELAASGSSRQKKHGFPYSGYGYAWVKSLQGNIDAHRVALHTIEVGKDKKHGFPYFGFGYAWAKKMEGQIAGNTLTLTASKVERHQKRGFPYSGFGHAWTQEMSGQCGEKMKAVLIVTKVARQEERSFPYTGFGLAWENEASLTLSLAE